ncbi:ATP-binding protein [Lysobacter enzymogenes]|uniref:AAA ATPase central domain protein n=1 Tax=Lysobacter enzymogenes TaxID=69 RepID=A0AAU9AJF2_LYSEN|nr:ATP-binding protein [Lysobacter enzymogenes]BAV96963.1 AAA ATPase central domain protein [Lysobacter enzymogenes]
MPDTAHHERERWIEDNNDYLAASLHWLRLRLQQLAAPPTDAASAQRAPAPGRPQWLGRAAPPPAPALPAPQALAERIADAHEQRQRAAHADSPPALPALAERLGLSPFETDILLLCAAMELDPSLPALIAAAQGGGPGVPTFALALRLFDEPSWDALAPQRPLRYLHLLQVDQAGAPALTAAALRADERVVACIKGLNLLDERLSAVLSPCEPAPLSPSQRDSAQRILAALRAAAPGASLPVAQLLGTDPGSRQAIACEAAQALGRHLYRLPMESLPAQRADVDLLARLWQRESLLLPVALYIDADALDGGGEATAALRQFLAHPLGLSFLGLRETPLALETAHYSAPAPLPSAAEQHEAWLQHLPQRASDDAPADAPEPTREREAAELSGHFQLNLGQIRAAAAAAAARDGDSAWDACRELSTARLDALAQRLTPKARWPDLVLNEESTGLLRQIAAQVRERHRVYQQWGYAERMNRGMGISALFAGESGTGKTMAAEVIANELRLDLFRIDLSGVVSKYIGETEKNLRKLFDAAEQGGAILFFDEADALFGKRSEVKDSHDRYANIEINYLLQRMEAFSGLAILATNMKGSLDTAFMRRLRFVVNFQFPGPGERKRLWRGALPSGVPCETLDYDRLARFNLSGGNIHSIALNAAFAAAGDGGAVGMPRLLDAVRTELRKLERPVNEAEFR